MAKGTGAVQRCQGSTTYQAEAWFGEDEACHSSEPAERFWFLLRGDRLGEALSGGGRVGLLSGTLGSYGPPPHFDYYRIYIESVTLLTKD